MKKRKMTKARGPNMLFPGLPNYHGPDRGWFAFIHHGKLFEHTSTDGDSIAARVEYVQHNKPADERRIRLSHIMYLGSYLGRKLSARQIEVNNTGNGGRIYNDETAKAWVFAYIEKHKPRNKWDKDSDTLVKANGNAMTG